MERTLHDFQRGIGVWPQYPESFYGLLLVSAEVHRLRPGWPPGPVDDLLKAAFGGLQLLLAVSLECLSALVKRDRIFEVDLALLEPLDDAFKLSQRGFETEALDCGRRSFALVGHHQSSSTFRPPSGREHERLRKTQVQ